jgi:ketopantoate reductase
VLELAKKYNIPVPVNQKVYADIKKIAAENLHKK